jgi:L-threonylcarbamoyladenylate synthase
VTSIELTTQIRKADCASVEEAARRLRGGELVAFPTETVYGLGADASNSRAVARLFSAKGRPRFNPLICHVGQRSDAGRIAVFDEPAERLAAAFWPGPLSLVLPKARSCPVCELATAGLDTIAVRVPAHSVARALLHSFAGPVVAPSSNRSGHLSPTTAAHVLDDLGGRIDLILDGGIALFGIESTIIASFRGRVSLLRSGAIPRSDIEAALGRPLDVSPAVAGDRTRTPLSPGLLSSHYAPRAALRLAARSVSPDEALLAFGSAQPPGTEHAKMLRNLSPRGDLVEAAANLFAHLRTLDASCPKQIAVVPIPPHGLGEAINDRLLRAAAPR